MNIFARHRLKIMNNRILRRRKTFYQIREFKLKHHRMKSTFYNKI